MARCERLRIRDLTRAGNVDAEGMIGPKKSALMMHAMGIDRARRLMAKMNTAEIDILSQAMDDLGTVDAATVEQFFEEFTSQVEVLPTMSSPSPRPETRAIDIEIGDDAPTARPNMTDFNA